MIVEKHEDIASIPFAWFNTLPNINLRHFVDHEYVGAETIKEIAEIWCSVTTFSIASCSLGEEYDPTDLTVVKDFLDRDRWGQGPVSVRQQVKHFRILADYTLPTGFSAAQLPPHLQEVATITSKRARIGIHFTSVLFSFYQKDWRNLIPFLQGFSVTVFPVLDQLVNAEQCVTISLES
jgi:hypothetical protein